MEVSCPECGAFFMTDGEESPIPCPLCECDFEMPWDDDEFDFREDDYPDILTDDDEE